MSATQSALALPTNTPATMAARAAVADHQAGRSVAWLELCEIHRRVEAALQGLRDAAMFAEDNTEARLLLELAERRLRRDTDRIRDAYRRGRWS